MRRESLPLQLWRGSSSVGASLHSCKGNDSLRIGGIIRVDPPQSPLCLFLDCRDSLNGIEHLLLLSTILDVGVNEEGVHLAMDVLNGVLKAIKASCLGNLNLAHEMFYKVLIDNAVGSSKESQNVFDEVPFIVRKFVPVFEVP